MLVHVFQRLFQFMVVPFLPYNLFILLLLVHLRLGLFSLASLLEMGVKVFTDFECFLGGLLLDVEAW